MKRLLTLAAFSALSIAPSEAGHHESAALDAVLKHERRAEDAARDAYRHPKETLEFFGITPEMTIVEMAPGGAQGGWYTRILLPLVKDEGRYIAANYHPDTFGERARNNLEAWPAAFETAMEAAYPGVDVTAFSYQTDGAEALGPVADAVLFFRALHGLKSRDRLDEVLQETMAMLKPGGIVGVVQHRAKDDAPADYVTGANGYLKQADVIADFEAAGFVFVKASDINANPKDPANWEDGVWTLPPANRGPEERREEFLEIGESDRMTLLFRKPA